MTSQIFQFTYIFNFSKVADALKATNNLGEILEDILSKAF